MKAIERLSHCHDLGIGSYEAAAYAEGFEKAPSAEHLAYAWQYLIDTGLCWRLQGWFGRTAADLIANGVCVPADQDGAPLIPEEVY